MPDCVRSRRTWVMAAALLLALLPGGLWAAETSATRAITLTAPTGGEQWAADSIHAITWTSIAAVNSVTLQYSTDAGATWSAVMGATGGTPATGIKSEPDTPNRLYWKVPPQPTPQCKVRVMHADAPSAGEAGSAEFSITSSQENTTYRWEQVTLNAAFAGRDGAGLLAFKDRLWLLGGWNPRDPEHFPKICNSEVWSSRDGLEWTLELLQAPWEGRHTAGYAVHDQKMWIVGGDANQHHYQNDVWNSADGVDWTLVNDSVPWGPRILHHTLTYRGKIWVIGGQTLPQFGPTDLGEVFYNDVWNTEDGVNWTRVAESAPWSRRGMIGGNAVFKGRMWILGGGTYDTPKQPARNFYNDVWSSEDGVNWKRHVEFAPWHPRQYHEVGVFDDKLWVMEGYDGKGNRNDVWYSADGVNWYELPDTPWAPRHAASVATYDGSLWMVAGNNMFPDVWRLRVGDDPHGGHDH